MATRRGTKSDLLTEVRGFIAEHPEGWGHDDWLGLLSELAAKGHPVEDGVEIGRLVEKERLAAILAKIEKVGPQRIKVIVDRYETLWGLREVDVDGLTESVKIPRSVAVRIKELA